MSTLEVAQQAVPKREALRAALAQWRLAICIVAPVIILLSPVPAGLTLDAWRLFAVYVAAILSFILRPYTEPVVILAVIAVSALSLGNGAVVMAGYASPVVWLVFSAFLIGSAIIETGLGRRIAYFLVGAVGKSTLELGYVAALTDLILAPATPSNTARSGGIVYPIIRSVAVSLGSSPGDTARRVGAYLTVLLYSISLTTGYVFLTAIAPNLLMIKFGESILKTQVDWLLWFKAAALPGLLCLFVLPLVVYLVYPPELKTFDNKEIARQGREGLGPMSWKERLLALFFVVAIALWATGSWTGIDATAVAIALVAASLVTGIIDWSKIAANQGAWSTLMWYGGIVGLADGLAKAKFFDWLAKLLAANLSFEGYDAILVMGALTMLCLDLWDRPNWRYLAEEFVADASSDHNIVGSVFVQCRTNYRTDGPEHLKPVGEVEYVASVAAQCPAKGPQVAFGIVGHADLRRGAASRDTLEAQIAAGGGRFKGIRHTVAWDQDTSLMNPLSVGPPGLMSDTRFREGFAQLAPFDLTFDAWLFHPQIDELADLAGAFSNTRIVLDHFGGILGIGAYAGRRDEIFAAWKKSMVALAQRENVFVKLGMRINGFGFEKAPDPPSSEKLAATWKPYVETCIEAFGARRCMFESNFPVDKGSYSYAVCWNAFKRLARRTSDDERAALFYDTARQFYQLDSR
jgi:DASS family divalent anion:Na+ symporter